jgi:predicted small lipoprotein YifL
MEDGLLRAAVGKFGAGRFPVLFFIFVLLALTGCGKKGPPRAPEEAFFIDRTGKVLALKANDLEKTENRLL